MTTNLQAQLVVDTTYTAEQLVDSLLVGSGVSVSNISYTGHRISIGSFSNGNSTNIGIDNGILITTGSVYNAIGPNLQGGTTTNTSGGSDPDLASITTGTVLDASMLEFDFIPEKDTLKLEYVFASEEYAEWVGQNFNDVFGFFITGPNPSGGNYLNQNIALVPGTNLSVTINNINNGFLNNGPCNNCSYYIDNTGGSTIEYDGFTTPLSSTILLVPCSTYHVKIAIGDVGDHQYDSGIFLKSNSFDTDAVTITTEYTNSQFANSCVEGCSDGIIKFKFSHSATYSRTVHYTIGGSAINGIDYTLIPDSVVIPANSDSAIIVISPLTDALTEGSENVQLIVHSSLCLVDTVDIVIQDYNLLDVNINTVAGVCIGDSITLGTNVVNGVGPYSYLWNTTDTISSVSDKITATVSYSVIVTDYCGFTDTDTITIIPDTLPIISITPGIDTICQGLSVNLKVIGANTYQWTPSTGLSATVGDSVVASPSTTTQYTVIGTNTFGCKDTAQTIISVLSLPNITLTPLYPDICIGNSTPITATGGLSYQWSPSNSLNQSIGATVMASPMTTTTYKLVATGANSCKDSMNVSINVHNLPNVSISPTHPELCLGQTKTLSASGAQNYLWSPATSLNTTTGNNVISNATTNTTYVVVGTDSWGCVNSDTVNLVVHNVPVVSVFPDDTTICENTSISLSATGANTYSWTPVTGLSSSVGDNIMATPLVSTVYTVIGTDSNGCADTAAVNITVSPAPVPLVQNQSICIGDSVSLSVSSIITGTSFIWSTGSTSDTISLSPNATTTYDVVATTPAGCIDSTQATVTVNPLPIISANPANPSICPGSSVNITASGASSYNWSPSNSLSSSTASTVTASPLSTTTYTIVGTSGAGCVDSTTLTVNLNAAVNVDIDHHDTVVCSGSTFPLTASGALNYSWSPATYLNANNTATVLVTPFTDITYIVSGTDANGCVGMDTVHISASPLFTTTAAPQIVCMGDSTLVSVNSNQTLSYLWNTGNTSSSFYTSPPSTTTYSVTVTDTMGCTAMDSVTVIVDSLPNISISPLNPDLCDGSTIDLTASGGVTYVWSPASSLSSTTGATVTANPTTQTTYTVIGIDVNGCIDTAQSTVSIIPSPTLSVNPIYDTICQGSTTVLNASGASSYLWSPAAGLSSSSGNSVVASPMATTNYKVEGTSANGCKDSAWVYIAVNAKPNLSVNPDTSAICLGDSVYIQVNGALSYNWSPAAGLSTSTASSLFAAPSSTTTYTIIGSTAQGCLDTVSSYVQIHSKPNLSLTPINSHMCPQDSITIIVSGASQYVWSPSNGLNSTANDTVIAKPLQSTLYQVIGSTGYGCTDTLTANIEVSPIPIISPANPTICKNDSIMLTVTSNTPSTTYLWNTGDTNDTIWVSPNVSTTYSVIATDSTMCTNMDSVTVVVDAIANLGITPSFPEVCMGDSVLITAVGADTYTWSPSSTLTAVTGNSVGAFPTINTTYKLIGTTINGCIDSINFSVNVHSLPNVSVSPTTDSICGGSSKTLIATGATNYMWSPSTTLNQNNNDTVVATPNSNIVYQVIGYDSNGCRDTASSSLTVYSDPVLLSTPLPICPGDTVSISANTTVSPQSYLWSNGVTSPTIQVNPMQTTTYSLTVVYTAACIKTDSMIVNVYADSSVYAYAQDYSICPGDTAHLIASGVSSYVWSPVGSLLQTTGSNVSALPQVSTIYTVEGTSVHGCKTTDTLSLYVFPQPHVTATASPDTICNNDSTLLIGNGAQSYSWLPTIGITNNALAQVYAAPDTTTNYIITGVDVNGCIDKDTILITVHQSPFVTISPLQPCICEGDTITLTAYGANSYLWTPNTSIIGNTSQTVQVYPPTSLTYNLRGFDANGCYADTSVFVMVKRNPILMVSPALDSICEGDSILISVVGAGGNGTYSWTPSTGLNQVSGSTVKASPASTTTYNITGVSTAGCSKTITSTIKVFPKPIFSVSSNPSSICRNDSAVLYSSGPDTYSWQANPSIYANWGDSIGVHPTSTTTYVLLATTINACTDSISKQLVVHQLPTINIVADDSTLCLGDSTQLNASSALSYNWNPNPALSQLTGPSVYASPSTNSTFIVKGTSIYGCENWDTLDIQVQAVPSVTAQATPSLICEGGQIALSAQSNVSGVSFNWSNGVTGNSFYDSPTTSTTYQVNGSTSFGCQDSTWVSVQVNPIPQLSMNTSDTIICDYDSLSLSVSSSVNPVNYVWNTSATSANIFVKPSSFTTYSVIVSDSIGCSDTISVDVDVQPTPSLSLSTSKSPICVGDTVLISSLTSGAVNNYLWSNNMTTANITVFPLNSSYYSLVVTDTIGCQNIDSVFQQVNPMPNVSINPSASQICIGDSISFTAVPNINPVNFAWNTGATSSTIIETPSTNCNYYVTVTDSVGCMGSDTTSIIVHSLPLISFSPANAGVCIGDSVVITANSAPAASSFLWSTNSNTQSISVAPLVNTSYSVVVTDIHNCVDSASHTVAVYSLPMVSISPSSSTICDGDTVSLGVSSNHPIQSVLWSNSQTSTNINVNPSSTQSFWVKLTDTNSCENVDTASVQVIARPSCAINAFPDTICSIDSSIVSYTGTATSAAQYNWDFDGATIISGSGGSPHILRWNNAGLKYITLDVTENACTSYPDTATVMVYLTPSVIFEALPEDACLGELVNFTNKTPNISTYFWDFGDLSTNKDTSSLENPSYIYNQTGAYMVNLNVLNNEGCSANGSSYVNVYPNPIAAFVAKPKLVDVLDATVNFTDVSVGAVSWSYDFGEPTNVNNYSNLQHPWHKFQDTGVYQVSLVVENMYGCADTAWNEVVVEATGMLFYPNAFTPNGDGINDKYIVKGRYLDWSTFEMYVYNRWGQIVFQSKNVNEAWNGRYNNNGDECPMDVYSLIISVSDIYGKQYRYNGSITIVR